MPNNNNNHNNDNSKLVMGKMFLGALGADLRKFSPERVESVGEEILSERFYENCVESMHADTIALAVTEGLMSEENQYLATSNPVMATVFCDLLRSEDEAVRALLLDDEDKIADSDILLTTVLAELDKHGSSDAGLLREPGVRMEVTQLVELINYARERGLCTPDEAMCALFCPSTRADIETRLWIR